VKPSVNQRRPEQAVRELAAASHGRGRGVPCSSLRTTIRAPPIIPRHYALALLALSGDLQLTGIGRVGTKGGHYAPSSFRGCGGNNVANLDILHGGRDRNARVGRSFAEPCRSSGRFGSSSSKSTFWDVDPGGTMSQDANVPWSNGISEK
jgi:hypothetical protein